MRTSSWGDVLWQTVLVFGWLAFKGLLGAGRVTAGVTVALLPSASSTGMALTSAVLTAGFWTILVGLPAAHSGDGAMTAAGLILGAAIGALVGYAVAERGWAQAAARAGAVQIGEGPGALGVARPHVIPREARLRHLPVFGPTGSGKTTTLTNLMLQDANAPWRLGLLCLDITDDLVMNVAGLLPAHRLGDVLLFDPADTDFPPAFNPFAGVPPSQHTLAAGELVSAFRRLFRDSWGPRLEYVLRACLLTLLETPEATLLDISRLLTNPAYRAWALQHVTNFSVRDFWAHEFPAIIGKNHSLANVQSVLNKLGIFAYPEVRNVLGQTRRGLDLAAAMDIGAIILANLPQGVLGEDAASFLASLLVARVQVAAQRRVSLPPEQRRPFYVFADEAQNYSTSSFDKLITEGRSMAVGLVVACQYREQLPEQLRLAIEKNCPDGLFCGHSQGRHLVQVVKWQEPDSPDAVRVLRALPPTSLRTEGQLAVIRARSRQILGLPRAEVEAAIARRMGGTPPTGAPADQRPSVDAPTRRNPSPAAGLALDREAGRGRFFE